LKTSTVKMFRNRGSLALGWNKTFVQWKRLASIVTINRACAKISGVANVLFFSTSMRTKLMMLKVYVEEVKMSGSDTAVSVSVTWSHPYTFAGRNRGDSDANCTSHLQ